MKNTNLVLSVIIILIFISPSSFSQAIFLDDTEGYLFSCGIFNNNISNGWTMNFGYTSRAKFNLNFEFTNYNLPEMNDAFSGYFSFNISDDRVPIKSLAELSFGIMTVQDKIGFLIGLRFWILKHLSKHFSIIPDIGAGFSSVKLNDDFETYFQIEPVLHIGIGFAYESRLGFIYLRPGMNFSRDIKSYLISLGLVFKN